jgi:hypothetical protein
MAAPATPQGFYSVVGNGQVQLQWQLSPGATFYGVQRSTDNVAFTEIATPAATSYLDTTALLNVQYWYRVVAKDGVDESSPSVVQVAIPTLAGNDSLMSVMLQARQRADRVGSNFVTDPELIGYINKSYYELYDLLVTLFEDYYLATPAIFYTTSNQSRYPLPNGVLPFSDAAGASIIARPMYKLLGVDLGLNTANNAFVTVNRFNFIDRNRFVYPNSNSTIYGVFNLQYRVMGDNIEFIPPPSANQPVRLWYIPKLRDLVALTDVLEGISGWNEYVITDAAIKILQKEESDVSYLSAQKVALIARINASASNRDAGQPDTISDTRGAGRWGGQGDRGGPGGSVGGW